MIVIVMGLPGSGKSYFALKLAAAIHADYLGSDKLRKTMIENRTYSPNEKEKVYHEMLGQARQAANQHKSLVLDATFYKKELREKFINEIAGADGIIFIEIIAPETLIKERLRLEREDSEADFAVYKKIQEQWEPFQEEHLILQSANDNINTMLDEALAYVYNIK